MANLPVLCDVVSPVRFPVHPACEINSRNGYAKHGDRSIKDRISIPLAVRILMARHTLGLKVFKEFLILAYIGKVVNVVHLVMLASFADSPAPSFDGFLEN